MKEFQRKAFVRLIATYLSYALFSYAINEILIFPTLINADLFFGITLIFLIKSFRNGQRLEKIGLLCFLVFSLALFTSESFVLTTFFISHEQAKAWHISGIREASQGIGLLALLSTILVMSWLAAKTKKILGIVFLAFYIMLFCLAFFDLNMEPLYILLLLSLYIVGLMVIKKPQISDAFGSMLYLWIIFTALEFTRFWDYINLTAIYRNNIMQHIVCLDG